MEHVLIWVMPGALALVGLRKTFQFLRLRRRLADEDVHVTLLNLFGLWFRHADIPAITNGLLKSRRVGLDVPLKLLEHQAMSGGDVSEVVQALVLLHEAGFEVDARAVAEHRLAGGGPVLVARGLIAAKKAGYDLSLRDAFAYNLKGVNILSAARRRALAEHKRVPFGCPRPEKASLGFADRPASPDPRDTDPVPDGNTAPPSSHSHPAL